MSTKEASRRSPQDDAWAVKVKTRAGWKCEWCGLSAAEIKALGGELQAAHIAPRWEHPEMALDLTNGKALCTFKDPRHRHPQGKGHGFGCHNSMSGHWKSLNMPTGYERNGDPWELWGFGLLGLSVVLGIIGFRAKTPLVHIWLPYVAGVLLAVSVPLWWVKRRHPLAVLVSSLPVWGLAVTANALLRRWPSLRPYLIGLPASSFAGLLLWLVALLALWGACLILCHLALSRRWLSRGGRGIWQALVRLARWAKP